MKIKYFYDPLCGWCYAASPALEMAKTQGIEIEGMYVGLFAGSNGRPLTKQFAEHAWRNDQLVRERTGQPYSDEYREKILGDLNSSFDSWMPTLAIAAHETKFKNKGLEFLAAIQKARFVECLDVTNLQVLSTISETLDWDKGNFLRLMQDPDFKKETQQNIRKNFATFESYNTEGIPLVVLENAGVECILNPSLVYVKNPNPSVWLHSKTKNEAP